MKKGGLYILKGGYIMRCHSSDRPDARVWFFRAPSVPLSDDLAGYAADRTDARELTTEDLEWLPERVAQLRARNLGHEADETELVIRELGTALLGAS